MHEMEAETLQRAMVSEFGGDPSATDSTRVLRVPNFVNRKYETQHLVGARAEATQTYHLEDFRLRVGRCEVGDIPRQRSNGGR